MKQFYTLAIAISLTTVAQAQNNAQAFDWAFNPGSANNILKAMKYDSQGNVLALCAMWDSANFAGAQVVSPAVSGYPSTNYYIGKRTTTGTAQILIERGSANTLADFSTFNLDANDNIIVAGAATWTTGYDFGNGVSVVGKGYMIAKHNASGVAQWARLYNFGNPTMNSFYSNPWKIQTLADGSVIALLRVSNKFALIKIDALGNELWYKEYAVATNGSTSTITTSNNSFFVDATGNITLSYLTAVNSGTPYLSLNNDTTKINNGAHPAVTFLVQFDSNGNKKWNKGFRGFITDLAVEHLTGNVLLLYGQYGGQNNVAPMDSLYGNNLSFSNTYGGILAVDSTGKFIKASPTQLNTSEYKSILPLGGFKTIVTRKYQTTDVLTAGAQNYSVSTGSVFAWTELDANLLPVYFIAEPAISTQFAEPENLMAVQGNKVAVCAAWQRTDQLSINVNGTTLTANDKNTSFATRYNPPFNMWGEDIMLGQYDRTLQGTTGITKLTNNTMKIYPNPSNGTFTVLSTLVGKTLTITDVAGKQVYNTTLTSVTQQINAELNAGIYFVKVGNTKTQKLIVE
ncbi:MAG: T9SS type A sorting domain-containing protein [Bacteroidia bacterium]